MRRAVDAQIGLAESSLTCREHSNRDVDPFYGQAEFLGRIGLEGDRMALNERGSKSLPGLGAERYAKAVLDSAPAIGDGWAEDGTEKTAGHEVGDSCRWGDGIRGRVSGLPCEMSVRFGGCMKGERKR